jgi:hypothetical protein
MAIFVDLNEEEDSRSVPVDPPRHDAGMAAAEPLARNGDNGVQDGESEKEEVTVQSPLSRALAKALACYP